MVGLHIKIPNECGNNIYKIINGINSENWVWKVCCDDCLCIEKDNTMYHLFENEIINNDDFFDVAREKRYCMIFVDIKAYHLGNDIENVESFNDFLNSNCTFVFLCTDSIFVECYAKDEKVLLQILSNCKVNNFEVEKVSEKDAQNYSMVAF